MPTSSPANDIIVSDHFHHLKRSALVFCSVIALTAVPGVDFKSATSSVWSPISGMTEGWALVLLWVGATYYVIGFCGEFLAAQRANTATLVNSTGKNLDAALKEMYGILNERLTSVRKINSDLGLHSAETLHRSIKDGMASTARSIVFSALLNQHNPVRDDDVKRAIIDSGLQAKSSLETLLIQKFAMWQENAAHTVSTEVGDKILDTDVHYPKSYPRDTATSTIGEILETLRAEAATLETLTAEVSRFRTRLKALKIYGLARTFMFWGWEGAVLVAVYFVSTLIAIDHWVGPSRSVWPWKIW